MVFQEFGVVICYCIVLDDCCCEIVILLVVVCWDSVFECEVYEVVVCVFGFMEVELVVLCGQDFLWFDGLEFIVGVVILVLFDGDFEDEVWMVVFDVFGFDGVFELSFLVGYYGMLVL